MHSALVGRDRELGVLLGCLDEALRGRASLVVCVGEPGIGKTRLVTELARRARESGVMTAWGRGATTDSAPPYWPWREVLRDRADEPSQLMAQYLVRTAGDDRLLVAVCCRETAGPIATLAQESDSAQGSGGCADTVP